jgi:hypothetical protein
MAQRALVWKGFGIALLASTSFELRADDPKSSAEIVLQQYCLGSHNSKLKTAGLVLESGDQRIDDHPDVWEKVVRKLRTGEMPPAGRPRPDAATYDGLKQTVIVLGEAAMRQGDCI